MPEVDPKHTSSPGAASSDPNDSSNQPLLLHSGATVAHAIRIGPNQDFVTSIQDAAHQAMKRSENCEAAFIMTAVGSLKSVTLRMASAPVRTAREETGKDENAAAATNDIRTWNENVEIVSLVGTISSDSSKHLHMTISKADGSTVGGHVISGTVFTTLELVLGTIENVSFKRTVDKATGYRELVVSNKRARPS